MHNAYSSEHSIGFNSNVSTIFRRVAMTTHVDKNVAARVHSGDADLANEKINDIPPPNDMVHRYMLDKKKRYGEAWLKELGYEGTMRDRTLLLRDDDAKIYSSSDAPTETLSLSTPTKKPSNLTIVVPSPIPVQDAATPPATPFFTPESRAGDPNTTPSRRSRPAVIMASRVSPARRHPHKYVKIENFVSNAVLVARHGSPMPSPEDFLNRVHRPAAASAAVDTPRLCSPSVHSNIFSPHWYRPPSPPRQRLLLTDGPVQTKTKFAKKRRLRSVSCFSDVWTKPWKLWGRRSRTTKKGVARKA
jgi:hypothetical protein